MPANALVKATKAVENWRWETNSPAITVMEVETNTPDVPYGTTFVSKVCTPLLRYFGDRRERVLTVVLSFNDNFL